MRMPFLLLGLLGVSLAHSNEKTLEQPHRLLTHQQEWELLINCAKTSHLALSEGIRELVKEITNPYFGNEFINKIAKLEATKLDGDYLEYWDNGQMRLQASFKKGKADGHIHGWYENGAEAFKAFFKEGRKIGIHLAFFPPGVSKNKQGMARLLIYNEEGKLEGEQTSYFLDGDLKVLATYKNGMLEGSTTLWADEGGCIEERQYKNGKLVETPPKKPGP